jgi:uncharacterized protein with ATP-grasp and redox domains
MRQTVDTVRYSTDDPSLQRAVINRVLHFLYTASLDVTPPELGKKVYRMIKNITRIKDPYRAKKHTYNRSELIISKGQGNYETLDQEKKLIYFLLKVKCPLIAKNISAREGDTVLKCNKVD